MRRIADARIRSLGTAWQHMIGNLIAVVLALLNWYLRYRSGAVTAGAGTPSA